MDRHRIHYLAETVPFFWPEVIRQLACSQPTPGRHWWAHQDLNLEPTDYESAALTN
jgi:hypothetical protein